MSHFSDEKNLLNIVLSLTNQIIINNYINVSDFTGLSSL